MLILALWTWYFKATLDVLKVLVVEIVIFLMLRTSYYVIVHVVLDFYLVLIKVFYFTGFLFQFFFFFCLSYPQKFSQL